MNRNIKPKEGYGDIRLGMPVEEVVAILGEPSSVENMLDAMDEPLTILSYQEESISLFFEGENPILNCIDICNDDATLFDEDIFGMNEEEILFLMQKQGYKDVEIEDEDWGERSISFPSCNVDFYFEDSELLSVEIGR